MTNSSELIDKKIISLKDWRGKMLANIRKIIHDADPKIKEEWKWVKKKDMSTGTPTFSHNGLVLLLSTYKDKLKLVFPDGANLPDLDNLFNAMLKGNSWRAIDFHEGDRINERALKNIIHAAVAFNMQK